ncbi:MAG: hypothetical protein NT094_02150 [Candidatus Staskawiczbacteria bacterium]|nr:hypothetical protein [Candidatus Staskawiczbacteria bacterium]
MDEQKNNIRVLFTIKANSGLEDIMKNFKLEETPEKAEKKDNEDKLSNIVIIDHLAKDFARETILEKDLINSLQKDLEVSQQIAEQISKEIITKIVPFLEKVPEEKFKDHNFREEISKKVFETEEEKKEEITQTKNNIIEQTNNITTPPKRLPRIKTPIIPEEIKQPTQPNKPKKPDSYREPIE